MNKLNSYDIDFLRDLLLNEVDALECTMENEAEFGLQVNLDRKRHAKEICAKLDAMENDE